MILDSTDFIVPIDSILVLHNKPPAFTPHTQGTEIKICTSADHLYLRVIGPLFRMDLYMADMDVEPVPIRRIVAELWYQRGKSACARSA